jgi:predicted DNA-binding protein YlxM (UPF0122 family)
VLDSNKRRQRRLRLYDLYASLLTDHQRRILHLAWEEDWSYGEIAQKEGVSRTAVYDLVRRSQQALEGYERKLQLHRERARLVSSLQKRVSTLEKEVGALARLIQESA